MVLVIIWSEMFHLNEFDCLEFQLQVECNLTAASLRCQLLRYVLLCSGRSGEAAEPPGRLQVSTHLCTPKHANVRLTPHDLPASRFVPRHADELQLETDDPVLMLNQSEDLWCQGYNMRTGASGIFPAFYAVQVPKDQNYGNQQQNHTHSFLITPLISRRSPALSQPVETDGQNGSWRGFWAQFRSPSTQEMTSCVRPCERYRRCLEARKHRAK